MRRRLERLLDGIEDISMIVFMAVAILVTFVQVVMRYGFNASLYWGEEVVLYSIICMSFVGVSMGLRYGAHISVDILKAFVGEKYATPLFLTSSALGIVFALALLLLGGELFPQHPGARAALAGAAHSGRLGLLRHSLLGRHAAVALRAAAAAPVGRRAALRGGPELQLHVARPCRPVLGPRPPAAPASPSLQRGRPMIPGLVASFVFLLIFGLPIFAALALSVIVALQFFGTLDPVIVPMRMFSGMNNFSLMAIPLPSSWRPS